MTVATRSNSIPVAADDVRESQANILVAEQPHIAAPCPVKLPGAPGAMALGDLEMLVRNKGLCSSESVSRARMVADESGDRLDSVLTRLGLVSEIALATSMAEATGLPLATAAEIAAAPAPDSALAPRFLRDNRILPLSQPGAPLRLAVANPLDHWPVGAVEQVLATTASIAVARAGDLDLAFDRLFGIAAGAAVTDDIADEADLERLKDMASDAPAIRAVNRLISAAVQERASDIHIEPAEDRLAVRFRIDGRLRDWDPLPAAMRLAFVSRVKVMAGLDIAEKRLPQDGRLRLAVRGHDIDLRIATAPTIHGESIVMRILDRSHLALDFNALGFDAATQARLIPVLNRPHGIMLVTGPTGSGKTTTLYAALASLNSGLAKILTVEDPIEYRLTGVGQTQVNAAIGLDFATALRSFLRQDPDVIMVGEIRDLETAQVAVQAALTGHGILSTLHTNSAAAAITRLLDMGVEPFLITSTLNAVLGQRLVRRLCPACRAPKVPDRGVLSALGLPGNTDGFCTALGCTSCGGSGFRGRVAVTELLVMSDALVPLILARSEARAIHAAACADGMISLAADGIAKARAGLTTLEELVRITSSA